MEFYLWLHRWASQQKILTNTMTRRQFRNVSLIASAISILIIYLDWCGNTEVLTRNSVIILVGCSVMPLALSYLCCYYLLREQGRNGLGVLVLVILLPALFRGVFLLLWNGLEHTTQNLYFLLLGAAMILVSIVYVLFDELKDAIHKLRKYGISHCLQKKFFFFQREIQFRKKEKVWQKQKPKEAYPQIFAISSREWQELGMYKKYAVLSDFLSIEAEEMQIMKPALKISDDFAYEENVVCDIDYQNNYIMLNRFFLNYLSFESILAYCIVELQNLKAYKILEIPVDANELEREEILFRVFYTKKDILAYDILTMYYAWNKASYYCTK